MIKTARLISVVPVAMLLVAGILSAQTDPGVQTGNRGTGAALSSVLSNSPSGILSFFTDGQARFQSVESVSKSSTGNNGLGPRFNATSCSACHAQPTVGGTGASINPQASFTTNGTAPKDTLPYFITSTGPTVEARFPFYFNSNGTPNYNAPNGGVETLFTVTGRSDAGSCSLQQPSFTTAGTYGNIIFRIPTPTFGAGLIENLDDSTLLATPSSTTTIISASPAPSTTTAMTAPSAASDGRRRTSRCTFFPAKPTTSRWASAIYSSRRIVLCPAKMAAAHRALPDCPPPA